ncbi:MarR family winged helix-turn-helix transcriptional regulator [Chitinophaga nivalis]|uniref:MarR family transcriptional regulator n=1 Tax=Chitinophaga nivalis TaxID=2991709 RepID=A0ABT3ILK1_9BACT|nr:MarR family transcriptional regulator [Chitinophaga nivalis]MCW3465496.1 MarR family transcriptional regulator [Chitinophaga nivalis]MCW3484813.1 MarR family transcriptional regulator [Chitinophaga nivalis]
MKQLKLSNQLCFPVYALSRLVTAHYQPLLGELDLTYPQYLVMLSLWEHQALSVKALGQLLMLDSGTLTPLLKRLEAKKLIKRVRSKEDERIVNIYLTEQGAQLKQAAADIPQHMQRSLELTNDEVKGIKNLIAPILKRHLD